MPQFRWRGHVLTPEVLFEAAREARLRSWLDEPSRLFLHRMGLALAAGNVPSSGEERLLDGMLDALGRRGSFAIASLNVGPAVRREPAAPVAWSARELSPVPAPPRSAAPPVLDAPAPSRLEVLEAELARLSVMLAAATERLEACREQIDRHQSAGGPSPLP